MARNPKSRLPPRKNPPASPSGQSAPTAAEQATFDKLLQQQKYDQAQLAAKTLAQKYPSHPSVWLNQAKVLFAREQWQTAQATLEKLLKLAPESPEALARLGYTHLKQNETALAIQHMQQALTLAPQQPIALIGLARAHFGCGDFMQAIQYCDRFLAIERENPQVQVLRAAALAKTSRIKDAIHALQEVLRVVPDDIAANNNIANLYLITMAPEKAEAHYRRAWELDKGNHTPFSNLFVAMHYNPEYQASDFFLASQEWEKHLPAKGNARRAETPRVTCRRIRVGLISGGFRTHPVGQMITSALENLSADAFELYAYATNDKCDPVTARIKQVVHKWQLIEHLSQPVLAERIRQDRIDILIDLNGPGEETCYEALATEPAPIQIKWVGSLINTTGLSAFDYLLSDSVETPEGCDSFYNEKLIRMPDDYICYTPPDYTPPQSSPPALVNGYITLGCLNNPAKLNRQLLAQWAELMHSLEESRLLLKGQQYADDEFCNSIRAIMAEHDIPAERLILEGPTYHQDFLTTYNRIDIALDTWPYSGGLTTCEAMLMGVPVVTLPGPTFAGRHSATHLINAGMPQLVTDSWEQYRQRVIELATDLPNLVVIRACLRPILLQSPVCDGPRFGKSLCVALRAIWQRHCEGKAPAALWLDKSASAHFEGEEKAVAITPLDQTQTGNSPDGATFPWDLDGKIIILDHGAVLTSDPTFPDLQKLDAFATITFDPTGRVNNAEQLQQNGELHYYPRIALGDDQERTLYYCSDPAVNATLEPLPAKQQLPGNQEATQVIAKLTIPTLRLDDIEGLENIDWLLLDNMNDSLAILENGEKALANTLLIQARVNFAPTHKQQPELTQISHWLARHGFSFYQLNNLKHYSHLPKLDDLIKQQATQLTCADALFIPNARRMTELTDNQRLKLAFVLHTAYGIGDLSYAILETINPETASDYLSKNGFLDVEKKSTEYSKSINSPEKSPHTYKSRAQERLTPRKNQKKVSVGVPVYNEEKYIEETINSLKNQSMDGVSYLISDNCSTDRTLEIIRDTVGNDDRFEIAQQHTNLGSFENFKFVFESSESEYFLWLGAHDHLSNDYLESTVKILDSDQSISMACGLPYAVFNGKTSGPTEGAIYEFSENSSTERYIKSVASLANCTVFHSLFRRESLSSFDFRKVISCDHVIISHLLWHGKLKYSSTAKYYRRYFEQRQESYQERLAGRNQELPRTEFYKYYADDFNNLAKGKVDVKELTKYEIMIHSILRERFK